MKRCRVCKRDLPLSNFTPSKKCSDGYRNYCKRCTSEKEVAYRRANRERKREQERTRREANKLGGVVATARQELAGHLVPLPIDSHDALAKCIAIAHAEVEFFSRKIEQLDPDETMAPIKTTTSRPLREHGGAESQTKRVEEIKLEALDLHRWYSARSQAMDRLMRYSKVATEAKLDERRVQVAEVHARMMLTIVHNTLAALSEATGIDLLNLPVTPKIIREQLTSAAGTWEEAA